MPAWLMLLIGVFIGGLIGAASMAALARSSQLDDAAGRGD